MNIEKLKPWNWFKHEDDSASQIPVSKQGSSGKLTHGSNDLFTAQNQAVGSLLQLQKEMEQLFDDVWHSFGVPSVSRENLPTSELGSNLFGHSALSDFRAKLDVAGSEKEYEVSIDIPGLSEDDIQIELNGSTLTVKGQKEEINESKEKQYYRMERSVGAFQRTLSLPEDADRSAISANVKNGLLVIKIPRTELPKDDVKRISISS